MQTRSATALFRGALARFCFFYKKILDNSKKRLYGHYTGAERVCFLLGLFNLSKRLSYQQFIEKGKQIMKYNYKLTLTKMDGYKVKSGVIKKGIITDEGQGAYPYILFINGEYIGKSKTLQGAERLAKRNFGLHYKVEKE